TVSPLTIDKKAHVVTLKTGPRLRTKGEPLKCSRLEDYGLNRHISVLGLAPIKCVVAPKAGNRQPSATLFMVVSRSPSMASRRSPRKSTNARTFADRARLGAQTA